jgi:hypothetical protein
MKLKGVNPIEQHIEKIVLAVVLILLLAVLSMQFVLRPNDIEVSSTRSVSPDQVYTVLESQANQLESQLSDQNPELPELQPVDLVVRYNEAFENSSGGSIQLSSALGTGVDIADTTGASIDIPVATDGPVAALMVPKTSTPLAASLWSTLDPYAVEQVPEYGQFIPAAQPYDFPSISIEANFSGKDLEASLLGKNGSNGAIPRRFWSATGLAILGFEAERQQLMEDGTWGSSEPIVTPPHTPKPIGALGADAGLLELTALVTTANGVVDEVARPMFPPTISGAEWIPPSERVATGNDSESDQIKRIQRRLDRAKGELERLTNAPTGNRDPGPGGGGKTSRTRDPQPSGPTSTNRSQQDRIKKLREDIKEYEKELEDLGVDLDDNRSSRQARTSKTDMGSILEEESVELWAHDLGVEPGATYRYRTRVVVNNPLFRKGGELDPDDANQQALTTNPFARGDWSSWSESVVAGAEEYFFVTGAESQTGFATGGTKATIELYKMFYGHYRKSTLSVTPGDELATTVRMSGDLLNIDTSLVEANDAAKAINDLADEDSSELPEGISELSNRMTIDLGVYLLDIYAGQGGVETNLGRTVVPMQFVLRDAGGNVIVRSDLSDESSLAYVLASESASAASVTALRPPGAPAISPAAELFEPKSP